MEGPDAFQLRDRLEELEESLKAATDVNRHLAEQVERMSLECDSLRQHVFRLRKRLKHSIPAPQSESRLDDDFDLPEDYEDNLMNDALSIVSTKDWLKLMAHGRSQGWLIGPSEVQIGAIAGEGAFGATHRGIWRGAECAVKVVRTDGTSAEAFARELSVLAMVRHRNVVNLYGAVIQPPERCWLVCEWLPGGTLSQWLHGVPGGRRPPPRSMLQRLQMALDVACGMEALEQHNPPILHRDLKPTNILIDSSGRAKISDMGLARVLTPEALMELTPETGSYLYMAPEVVRHELYATQADVWSWGCVVSELLTGLRPYQERLITPIQVALKVADGGLRPTIPATCPDGLSGLLDRTFHIDPLSRPSFAVAAEIMRRVVREEERKDAIARGVAGAGQAVASAWARWMRPPG